MRLEIDSNFTKLSKFSVRRSLPDLSRLILFRSGEAIVGILNDIVAGIFATLVVGGYNH